MPIPLEPILAVAAAFLAAGTLVLALLSAIPGTAALARPLWPTLASAILVAVVIAGALWIGGWVLKVALLLLAGRIGYEAALVALHRIGPAPQTRRKALAAGVALAGACGLALLLPLQVVVGACLVLAAVTVAALLLARSPDTTIRAWLDVLLFPGLAAPIFVAAVARPDFAGLALALFLLVETFDSYALLGGKLFGRTPAFPKLSPRKTIEGLAVGAVALALTTLIAGGALLGVPATASLAVAALVGIAATAGDLAASRLKRLAGVKDFAFFLPRQGGLLDTVNSWLLTVAATVAVLVLTGRA